MVDALAQGILLGGLYASVALGLSVVFGVLRLVNLAHGELLIGAAFLAFLVVDGTGVDPLLSLLVVAPAMFAIAYPIQRYVLTPVLTRSEEAPLVATFGLSLAATGLFAELWGSDPRSLHASWASTGISILGIDMRVAYVIAFAAGVLLVTVTHLALTRTRRGAAVRAAAADPDTAAVMGIDARRVYATTFGIAAAMAAVGGVFIGTAFSITPTGGVTWLLTGFAVVVLGGIGSVSGTLVGGLAVGVVEAAGIEIVGGAYRDLIVYGLFFVALTLRPTGIFGRAVA
jgi:branched-chain amino acid transport system permease protein